MALSAGFFLCACGSGSSDATLANGGSNAGSGGTAHAASQAGGSVGGSGLAAAGTGGRLGGGGSDASAGYGMAGAGGGGGQNKISCAPVPGSSPNPVGAQSVIDDKTCLIWTKARYARPLSNKAAARYCAGLEQDGIADWRVPRPEELATWPGLIEDSTAYITSPIYVPKAGTSADGCAGNSHSCNLAKYNASSVTCAWQGVGFQGWVECVSGAATPGTTDSSYAASTCSPCRAELATFNETDCSAFGD